MTNFRNWDIYCSSKKLVKQVYLVTSDFPESEKFGLISQVRRAAVSIPTNIAEGAGRQTDKDFRNFLYVALGSAFEVETLLELSFDLNLVASEKFGELKDHVDHIQRQLNSFIQKLN